MPASRESFARPFRPFPLTPAPRPDRSKEPGRVPWTRIADECAPADDCPLSKADAPSFQGLAAASLAAPSDTLGPHTGTASAKADQPDKAPTGTPAGETDVPGTMR